MKNEVYILEYTRHKKKSKIQEISKKVIEFDLLLLSMQLLAHSVYVLFGKQKKSYHYLPQHAKQIKRNISLEKKDRCKEKEETQNQ